MTIIDEPSSQETDISDDLLLFKLPFYHLPGQDKLSKSIMKTPAVIDLVTNEFTNVVPGTYCAADCEWNDGKRSDVLYVPRLGIQQSLPPILVEIQSTVDEAFMRRLIQYCENITNVYGKYPVVLILCINKVSPSNLMTKFDVTEAKQWLRSIISCDFWAKSCYLVTDSTLSSADATATLTPLQALATFMIERSPTLYGSSHPDNPTIRHFYCIARDIIDHDIENERELTDVVDVVCTNNLKILDKLHGIITNTGTGYSSARRLIQTGMDYNKSVKRKFETAESDISLEPLPELHLAKYKHKTKDDDMAYIMDYKANHKGQMNWKLCLESGHSKQKLLSFGTKEALRSFYNKNNRTE